MKSVKTPHTHTAVTAEELAVTFKPSGSRIGYDLVVPAGTPCVKLEGGSAPWVVDDLTFIGDTRSILYHDASHHGITIDESKLTNISAVTRSLGNYEAQHKRIQSSQHEDAAPTP